jgi:hypothetical protein
MKTLRITAVALAASLLLAYLPSANAASDSWWPENVTPPIPAAPTLVSESDPYCTTPNLRCDGVYTVWNTPAFPSEVKAELIRNHGFDVKCYQRGNSGTTNNANSQGMNEGDLGAHTPLLYAASNGGGMGGATGYNQNCFARMYYTIAEKSTSCCTRTIWGAAYSYVSMGNAFFPAPAPAPAPTPTPTPEPTPTPSPTPTPMPTNTETSTSTSIASTSETKTVISTPLSIPTPVSLPAPSNPDTTTSTTATKPIASPSETITVIATPAPIAAPIATTATPTIIESDGNEEEPSANLVVTKRPNGKYLIAINSNIAEEQFVIVATKKGSKAVTYRATTNDAGDVMILTARNLSGFTLTLRVNGDYMDKVRIK